MPFAALVVEIAVSYLISRLSQPNGPRVTNLAAGGGDYGVIKPIILGEKFRVAGVIIAEDDIKETVHKHKPATDYIFGIVGALLPATKTYTYSVTIALLVADRTNDEPIEGVEQLYAGGKVIFRASESSVVSETLDGQGRLVKRKYGKNKFCKSVTVYGGGFDQTSDPILNAVIGAQPGYRGSAYVVIEDLQLKDFGNAPPLPIEVLVENETGQTLAAAVEKICAVANIDPTTDMSSTALAEQLLLGCGIVDQGSCWDAMKPLLPAFGVDAAETAGQIRFYQRAQTMRATILPGDMGAYVYGDSPPDKFTFSRQPDLSLPKETSLTFVDPARDYQPNTAKSERSEGDAKSNIGVSIPVVLTADQGATAAGLIHWDAWLGRSRVNFTLTDSWNSLEPGLAYAIPIADQFVPYRITRKARGANGIHEIEGLSDESVTYTGTIAGTSGTPIDPGTTEIADTRIVPIDGAILNDTDDEYGFYVVMAGGEGWDQGEIEASLDGITYLTLQNSSDEAVIGDVTGTLTAGTTDGLDDTLDTTSVLTVVLIDEAMELVSATDAELDTLANMSFVGKDGIGEYLQFKTATFISGSTWQLTNLRRGRKGTDWAIAAHASGEEFALLTDGGVFRFPATTLDSWGVPISLRGVTFNQDEADADVVAFTNTGEGKRPYSPVNVAGSWDGSNNITITWDSRSRLNTGGLGIDDQNNYDVEITSGAGRAITATGVETATYSAANQITDGLTPGDSITGRVRQASDVNDGRWRDFMLTGPNGPFADTTSITADTTATTADT